MRLKQTLAPEKEPVSLDEAKNHLKVDTSEDDSLILGLIKSAREIAEHETNRALITQEWELILDTGGEEIDIPKPPIQSVDSIKVITEAGSEVEVSATSYYVDLGGKGRVRLKTGSTWPTHRGFASFIIAFTCGYGDNPEDVPRGIRDGILKLITHLYENRGDDIPKEALSVFAPYKVWSI